MFLYTKRELNSFFLSKNHEYICRILDNDAKRNKVWVFLNLHLNFYHLKCFTYSIGNVDLKWFVFDCFLKVCDESGGLIKEDICFWKLYLQNWCNYQPYLNYFAEILPKIYEKLIHCFSVELKKFLSSQCDDDVIETTTLFQRIFLCNLVGSTRTSTATNYLKKWPRSVYNRLKNETWTC